MKNIYDEKLGQVQSNEVVKSKLAKQNEKIKITINWL